MSCCMCEPMVTAQSLDDDTHAVVTSVKEARVYGPHGGKRRRGGGRRGVWRASGRAFWALVTILNPGFGLKCRRAMTTSVFFNIACFAATFASLVEACSFLEFIFTRCLLGTLSNRGLSWCVLTVGISTQSLTAVETRSRQAPDSSDCLCNLQVFHQLVPFDSSRFGLVQLVLVSFCLAWHGSVLVLFGAVWLSVT